MRESHEGALRQNERNLNKSLDSLDMKNGICRLRHLCSGFRFGKSSYTSSMYCIMIDANLVCEITLFLNCLFTIVQLDPL